MKQLGKKLFVYKGRTEYMRCPCCQVHDKSGRSSQRQAVQQEIEEQMGLFDSVFVRCPKCDEELEFQSKSGPCHLGNYSLDNAPDDVMEGVSGEVETCPSCHSDWRIVPVATKIQYGIVDPSEHSSECRGYHCSRCGSCDGGSCICYAR